MSEQARLRGELDAHEQTALERFVTAVLEEPRLSNPQIERHRLFRGLEGQIMVPVLVTGERPDMQLALFMAHKAEHLYKQTGCRFVLVQHPTEDPKHQAYVWGDDGWGAVP